VATLKKKKKKSKTTTAPDTDFCCCRVCGSHDVQYSIWYSPNTDQTHDLCGSWNNGDNSFCEDCDMEGRDPNPSLMHESEDPALYAKLRRVRVKLDAKAKADAA